MDMFNMEDQSRADQAVSELELLETMVEVEEGDSVRDAIQAVPRLPPTPAQVRIQSEDRFDRYVYNAFVICGANTRVAAFCLEK